MEQEMDKDRTKKLKRALKIVWRKLGLRSPIFVRFPFDPCEPIVPKRTRDCDGRFLRIPRKPHESC